MRGVRFEQVGAPVDMCGVCVSFHRENNYGGGGGGESDGVTVFVKGFDPSYGSEDEVREALQETFKDCGEIKSIRLPSDREAGTLKGFAYIEFGSTEAKVGWTGRAGATKRSCTCASLGLSHKGAASGVPLTQQRVRTRCTLLLEVVKFLRHARPIMSVVTNVVAAHCRTLPGTSTVLRRAAAT